MTREEGLGRAVEVRLAVEAGRLVDVVGSAIMGADDLLVFAGGGGYSCEMSGWHGFSRTRGRESM